MTTENVPKVLYKIVSKEGWKESLQSYFVFLSPEDDAFIHLATSEQLQHVIDKYWAEASEFFILKVETKNLPGKMVFEANPGKTTKYYHLYHGWIPREAVVEVTAAGLLAAT